MSNHREKVVITTSIISIAANIVLAAFKAAVGWLAHSIAIISDAVNNLSDALSSIITIVGTKLAGKRPDRKHPYGYGRIEYITSMVVSAIVLYAGLTTLVESVKKIIRPEPADYSTLTLVVLVAAIVVKYILGIYVKKKGRQVHSDALVVSGTDAFNDALLSISVLASALIYLLFEVSLEAYVGVMLAVFIIKTGLELIREAVDNILEVRVESKLAQAIKADIAQEKNVCGVFDLVLNNYGPDNYLGSIHVELPDKLTVADVNKLSRQITKKIMDKYGVILHTIGVYSVNTQDKDVIAMRRAVKKIIAAHPSVIQMHGFYVDQEKKEISFDIIIDYQAPDSQAIYQAIYDTLQKKYPDYRISIALDVDISD